MPQRSVLPWRLALGGESTVRPAGIFERVETIELSWYWWRLWRYRNVRLRHGDSARLLRRCTEPTLIWLDGHESGGHAAGEAHQCPLLDELRATSLSTPGDVYLIDDARLLTELLPPELDPTQWPTLDQIRDVVAEVRPDYTVGVREDLDLLIAKARE
jgi:hypothetical protein